MKKIRALSALMALGCLLACGGSSIEGTYYNVDNQNEYIELKSGGQFYLKAGALDLAGKYEINGNTIILNPKTRTSAAAKIDNGVIIDNDGTRWKKK